MKGIRRVYHHYPYGYGYNYPYYGYPYDYYDRYRRSQQPPMYIINKDDGDSAFPKIDWPTLAASVFIGAFLWGMRR